ncbi:MAG: hypothetical protein FWD18_10030 [Micrococcales bacterium]|nr:hypothetical protein [Micrococcales bacterium]
MSWVDTVRAQNHNMCQIGRDTLKTIQKDSPESIRRVVRHDLATGRISTGQASSSGGLALTVATSVGWHALSKPTQDKLVDLIADPQIRLVRECCTYLLKIVDQFDLMVEWMGGPQVLRDAGEMIDEAVSGPTNSLAERIDKEKRLPGMRSWKMGDASEYYDGLAADQLRYLDFATEYAGALRDALKNHANAIEQFNLGLIVAIAGLLVEIGSFAAAVVTAPAGPVGPIVAAAIAAVGGYVVHLGTLLTVIQTAIQSTNGTISAVNSAFKQTWPVPEFLEHPPFEGYRDPKSFVKPLWQPGTLGGSGRQPGSWSTPFAPGAFPKADPSSKPASSVEEK